jgi:serine/threonine protein kinase
MNTTIITEADLQALADALPSYHVQEVIGRGGQADVVAAYDKVGRRHVAIKVLKGKQTPGSRRRFETEAATQAAIVHPHVVTVYISGAIMDGRHFLIMERMAGSLRALGAPHPPAQILQWLIQAADGLGALHALNGVHRDVKPSNLLLTADGTLKVADFGIMKLFEANLIDATATDVILGTPPYLSPEQWLFERLSPATDFYALGIVAYQLLTGRLPFEGSEAYELKQAHLTKEPDWPANVSPELTAIVMRCLAKQPADRYQSAQELIMALTAVKDLPSTASPSPNWVDPDASTLKFGGDTRPYTAVTEPASTVKFDRQPPPMTQPAPTAGFWGPALSHLEPRKTAATGDIVYLTQRWSQSRRSYHDVVCIRYQDGHVSWLPIHGRHPDVSVQGVVAVANGSIETVKLDGSDHRELVDPFALGLGWGGSNPRWSLDGKRLAFVVDSRRRYVVNADGTGLRRMITTGFDQFEVRWSPESERMVIYAACSKMPNPAFRGPDMGATRCQILSVVNLETGVQMPLLPKGKHTCNAKRHFFGSPSWWPDGHNITVKVSFDAPKADEIWRYTSTSQFSEPGDFTVEVVPFTLAESPRLRSPDGDTVEVLPVTAPESPRLRSFKASATGNGLLEMAPPQSDTPKLHNAKIYLGKAYGGEFLQVAEGSQATFVNAPFPG